MGPLSYMRSVVDRNVVMRPIPVLATLLQNTSMARLSVSMWRQIWMLKLRWTFGCKCS